MYIYPKNLKKKLKGLKNQDFQIFPREKKKKKK